MCKVLRTATGYSGCPISVSCSYDQITHLLTPRPSEFPGCPQAPPPASGRVSHPASAAHADSRQNNAALWRPLPACRPLTAAAPPGCRRRPQQRAVNLLQPLQVSLPARAGLASHLLHGCYHGVEIVLQGVAGTGLSRRGVRAWVPAQQPPTSALVPTVRARGQPNVATCLGLGAGLGFP